jgi:hypothetical protein
VFLQVPRNLVSGRGVPTSIGNVSTGFGDARATGTIRGRCIPRGVAMRRAPEPGPIRGDRGELFDLF